MVGLDLIVIIMVLSTIICPLQTPTWFTAEDTGRASSFQGVPSATGKSTASTGRTSLAATPHRRRE